MIEHVTGEAEEILPRSAFAKRLRELADLVEEGGAFSVVVAGHSFTPPPDAVFSVEYEASEGEVELEFQIKWQVAAGEEEESGNDALS